MSIITPCAFKLKNDELQMLNDLRIEEIIQTQYDVDIIKEQEGNLRKKHCGLKNQIHNLRKTRKKYH